MKLPLHHVDTFAERLGTGNPAAVVPLQAPLSAATMQAIAAENNLPETAFVELQRGTGGAEAPFPLRWFTPQVEVDLCGHATLATAFVLLSTGRAQGLAVHFVTASGVLAVRRAGEGPFQPGETLSLDAPAWPPRALEDAALLDALAAALGERPLEAWRSRDVLLLYPDESAVRALRPDMPALAALDLFGVIATARGAGCDFVSRFFAPRQGVPEDPVTGSAHCTLTPFWAARLQRTRLAARQVSARGGDLACELRGERVLIGGRVVPYLQGEIEVGDG